MKPMTFCGVLLLGLLAAATLSAQVTVPSAGTPDMGTALSQVNAGGTITVTANLEENQTYVVGVACTIQGQNPTITLRRMSFLVSASNVAFRDLVIDGKDTGGTRDSARTNLVRVTATANNFLMENCRVVHPGPGFGNGIMTDVGVLHAPSSSVEVAHGGNVTIRNCNFLNDVDAGIDNETNIFFSDAFAGNGPILIEGCSFGAHSRGIQVNTPHANMTIRNNTFLRTGTPTENGDHEVGGFVLATDYNDLGGQNGPLGLPIRDLVIEGNTFGASPAGGNVMENNGVNLHGPIDNVYIRNNVFHRNVLSEAVFAWVYGQGLFIHDNLVDADSNGTGAFTIQGTSTQLFWPDSHMELRNIVLTRNTFTPREGTGIGFGFNTFDALVEDSEFTDCPTYGVWSYFIPSYFTVRNCLFTRCGTNSPTSGNVEGAVLIQSEYCSVLNNVMIDCRDAVALDPENPGGSTAYGTIATNGALIAGNYMLRPTRYGIDDTNGSDDGLPNVLAEGVQIINNTIVFPGIAAMSLRSKNFDVYNNIMHGGTIAITNVTLHVNAGTFAPTFRYRGFNLNFNNNYQGMSPAATDITANPRFVGGLAPSDVAGLALLPDSPARRAGTSNGYEPDYWTHIGAWQDAQVDTAVPGGHWNLYR